MSEEFGWSRSTISLAAALGVLVLVVAWPLAWFFLKDDPTDLGVLPDGERPVAAGHQVNPAGTAERPLQANSWRMAVRHGRSGR